ncbi:MAG TPA: helix-turn-helix transcriptional regulator [Anaerolineales bacterium]|nr:helix-turn-helix transcriptional regulator [Anaerolineales bacterium]
MKENQQTQMSFHYWLEQKFIEWMATEKQRKTLTAFANHIGVSQPLMTRYMSGQVLPTEENILKIAARLGPEVYDVLGLARPDPLLQYITARWHKLPPKLQEEILSQVTRYEAEANEKDNPQQKPKTI